jgi:murein DD-endopeptidase MepM/ murein hydrolase activator NlpD
MKIITADATKNGTTYVTAQGLESGNTIQYFHTDLNKGFNVGDIVDKGVEFGKTNLSGYSTGNHVHFVVIDSAGARMNPMNYFGR